MQRVFDQQAAAHPDAVAIECGEQRWTYAEIAAASRSFAADLRRAGVRPRAIVGIGIGRSVEFVVAVLAVLRCGAAYAPLPIDDPVDRLASMVDSAGVTAIVTAEGNETCSPLFRARPGLVRLPLGRCLTEPGLDRLDDGEEPACDAEDPAYVMFTSGSTGTPKGVVVPHRAVVGLVTGQTYADFGPELRTVMAAPTAFDASTFEVWGPLLHGGTVVVYPDRHFDLHRFGAVVRAGGVNSLFLTSGLFNHVVDNLPTAIASVRHVITGGDVASSAHFRRALQRIPGLRLTHAYGPTETTTFACTHDVDPADTFPHGSVPLGSPLAHTDLLVVSEDGHPVADGAPGELWIGGSGVAKGYLSGSEGKFVADPRPDGGGETLYRSGDLCRRLPDGTLLFLGRIDAQVKVRGHRVEPGEIEAKLLEHPLVRAAAVIPFKHDGETTLAAFVDRSDQKPNAIGGFQGWLEANLPQAFVPARVVVVEALPVNLNGKLDRARLLALLEASDDRAASAPPRPGTESRLAAPWRELLGGQAPGRDDDFFARGGHSLLAMRLVAAIEREFRIRLPVTAIFEMRTLSRLAAAIDVAADDGTGRVAADDPSAEPVNPACDERFLPALPAQRGMWLLDALLPDRATYNQPFAFRPDGPVDWESLRRALRQAMARHGALRSRLVDRGDGPEQRILPISSLEVPWAEESLVGAEGIEGALFDHGRRPFDLDTAPLWRATLFPRAATHGILLLTFHHAIIDDWSIDLLLRELARPDGESDDADTAGRALAPLSPAEEARCTRFWKETLAGASGALPWPGRLLPLEPAIEACGGLHRFVVDGDLAGPLRAVARDTGATEFQILLAAFHAWLRRMTGADDIVVGTPVSLRRSAAEQASIGCFLNTLPVRVRWDGDMATAPSFFDHVRQVQSTFLAAVGHGSLPFDEIVSAAADRRSADRAALVTTLFVATPAGVPSLSCDGTTLNPIPVDTATAKFDLTLFLEGDGEGWRGAFEFDRRRFEDATINRFATTFPVFLEAVLTFPEESVERASLLSGAARRSMLDLGNPADPLIAGRGLVEGFRAQVRATPQATAVRWSGGTLSYRELHDRSERIAARLRRVGVSIDTPVAICLPRSPELQAAILGVLMADAGCVPLDPTLPPERLAAMVTVSRCPWVVCDDRSAGLVAAVCDLIPAGDPAPQRLRIDAEDPAVALAEAPAELESGGDRLAYILFTSGSTGVPKGVEMSVGPLANLVAWQCRHSVVGPGARTLQFASAGFDVSFQELFSTWLSGGELVIVPEEIRLDPVALLDLVKAAAVERIFLPVAVLEHLAEAALATERFPQTLLEVVVAGEQLRIGPAIRGFFARMPAAILWNQYGPTESHVVTSFVLDGDPAQWPDLPPIGRPIDAAVIRVLDAALEPVPTDVVGEIWIGGGCLARGYAGRPDLTAERFVDDPFSAASGGRLYRSGDIGRWRADGELEYLGRADRQVKIRGHRVEPDEVEAVLTGHPLVAEAAVVARRDDRGEWFLVSHVVPAAGAEIRPSDLVAWLATRLPAAMLPERIGVIERLPLTPNGKIDRAALPDAAPVLSLDVPRSPPRGAVEEGLAAIWCSLLRIPAVGRDDDFFACGGHSLLSMRMVAEIERRFGVRLPVKTVFQTPVLADLAARIGGPPVATPESTAVLSTVPAAGDEVECQPLPMQRGLWLLHSLLPDSSTYNVPIAFRPLAPVDWEALQAALVEAMNRHPALRASLGLEAGELRQRHARAGALSLPWRSDPGVGPGGIDAALEAVAREPFDLSVPPLWRGVCFPNGAAHGVLIFVFHHTVIDDWSIRLVLDEISGKGPPADRRPIVAPSQRPQPDGTAEHIAYWMERLSGAPSAFEWPQRQRGRATLTGRGSLHRFTVAAPVVEAWRRIARGQQATLFHALIGACHVWLQRLGRTDDTVVLTPFANRDEAPLQSAVGCYLNTLPIRLRQSALGDGTASGMVRAARDAFLADMAHASLPFDGIVSAVPDSAGSSLQPLGNVALVFLEEGAATRRLAGVAVEPIEVHTGTARFDLTMTLRASDTDGSLEGTVEYALDVLDESVVRQMVERYLALLRAVADDPQVALESVDLLSDVERRRVVQEFNDNASDAGPPTTLHERFTAQARRTPHAVALSCQGREVTYAALDTAADRLAGRLASSSVAAGRFVGILLDRSVEFVVAALGILKAGCVYVPLPPDNPAERLAFMIEDADVAAIVTSRVLAGLLPGHEANRVLVDSDEAFGMEDSAPSSAVVTDGDMPAYVMYTSGSTGKPKGVVVPHRAVVRLVCGQSYAGFGPELRTLLLAPVAFDASTFELWAPLLSGGTCVIFPDRLPEPSRLGESIVAGRVNCLWLTAALFNHFVDTDPHVLAPVDHVITGGEALSVEHVRRAFERLPRIRLTNGYGPTESTTFASTHAIDRDEGFPDGSVPIGRPLANTTCYVVDDSLRPMGIGWPGELLIGGDGVAIGYLRRPELTKEKFIHDPFSRRPGSRLYRTGDLCRWRSDGTLEFLGRIDGQLKIRGFRIEPKEIETALEEVEGVKQAVVIGHDVAPGDRRLVAYLVAGGTTPDDAALSALLASRLPEAMVPWRFIRLDMLPVSSNGKLDHTALPLPDNGDTIAAEAAFSPPRGMVEEVLAAIWCDLLGLPAVSRDDGFFARGGNSLLAMRLVAAIDRRFDVRLTVRSVFESPKLSDLAAVLSVPPAALPESAVALKTIPATNLVIECRPLPMQRGLWLLQSLLPDPGAYNVPIAWRVAGPIDWPRLERALATVVIRHPSLRTALVEVDGDLVQRILPAASVAVPWQRITLAEPSRLPAALLHEASAAFDLTVAPLLRAVRFDVAGADPVLMLSFHHAIVDEWSIGILRRDLAAAYAADGGAAGVSQPIVTSVSGAAEVERHRRFWREELAAVPVETTLPGKSSARAIDPSRGNTRRFKVGAESLDRLRHLAGCSGVTLFNLLLASAHAWLQRVTGQRDLVIGTPVATRGDAATAGAVGCLINVLPVRVRFDDGATPDSLTLSGFAAHVQEIFLRALDHADLPFDEIVAAAVSTRQGIRQPLVNVLLTVVEAGSLSWSIGDATLQPVPIDTATSRFDLSMTLQVCPDGLEGSLEVAAGLMDRDVVVGLASQFESFLIEAAAGPTVPIARMAMLPTTERRRLLDDFNDTAVDLGPADTLHQIVTRQSEWSPTAVAVGEGGRTVTYAELEGSAVRLALRLRQAGIGPGDRVGIALPRSIDAVASMLAVLRVGAAWVPLDREASPARTAFIASDAGLAAIIAGEDCAAGWPAGVKVVDPDDPGPVPSAEVAFPDVDPAAAAYVMYTSGSTGRPKGVVIPHAAVVNYLRGKQRRFPLDATDVMLHATRATFDISVYEVFGPLLAGASLVILPPGRTDPVRVAGVVREAGVTVAQFVPSLLALLVDDDSFVSCPTLRRVFCGGEAMPVGVMDRFLDRSAAELINVYGPTEATVWATAWVCRRNEMRETPPIGRPLDNVRCYVLDAGRRPVPVGTVGELFLGGGQLAIGYHNLPDLTAERFLPDPFASEAGARMYRTGDACRWRQDGLLEFVTRTDQQVKIRGHRIEPAEIEACLAGHPEIATAAVVVVDPPAGGAATLVAGVVSRGRVIDTDALRRWTAQRLPEVMVPARFSSLDALPMNANGKIDRAVLTRQLAASTVAASVCAPRPTEAPRVLPVFLSQVRAAWQRVFGRVDFGDEENFFHALGGQSIMAARLVADLSTVLGRRVPLAAVFEAPTVMAMAALLRDDGWTPRFRSIVPLQPLGMGPPLFLLHGIGGGVTETLDLARAFGPDVPVYGLQAIDRDGGEMQTSLEACGALYAAEIVDFQPQGPYFLGGFSLGGWFAYETARQLLLGGHEVALLAQLDTHINCILPDEVVGDFERAISRQYVWKNLRRFASHPKHWWRSLRKLPGRYRLARQWRAVDPIRSDRHGALVASYRAVRYPGRVDYFQSADSLPAALGVWKRWCPGGVTVHPIPGEHHEIVRGANAIIVANVIRGIIRDRALQARGSVDPADGRAP